MSTPVGSRFPGAPCPSQRVIHKTLFYELDTTPFLSTSPTEGVSGWGYFDNESGLKGRQTYQYPAPGDLTFGADLTSSMLEGLEHFVYPEGISLSTTPKPLGLHSFVLVGAANMPPIAYKLPNEELPMPLTTPISPPCYCFVITQWSLVNSDVAATIKLQIASELMSSTIDISSIQTQQAPEQIYAPRSIAVISTHSFGSVINEVMLRTTKDCLFDADLTQYLFCLLHCVPVTVAVELGASTEETRRVIKAPGAIHDSTMQLFDSTGYTKGCGDHSDHSNNTIIENLNESKEMDDIENSQRPLILTPLHGLPLFAPPPGPVAATLPSFTFPPYPFNTAPLLDPAYAAIYASRMSPTNTIHLLSAQCSGLSIVAVSSDVSCITPCIEALLSFLYPLQYPYVYIPLLPDTMMEVVSAPLPYLVGVTTQIFERLEFDTQVIIANLDDDTVESIVDGVTNVFPPPMQHPTHGVWRKGELDVYVPRLGADGGFAVNGYLSQLRAGSDNKHSNNVGKEGLFEYEWGQSKLKEIIDGIPLNSRDHPLQSWLKIPHDEEIFMENRNEEDRGIQFDDDIDKLEDPPYLRRRRITDGRSTEVVLATSDNSAASVDAEIHSVEELLSIPLHPDPIHFSYACPLCLHHRVSREEQYRTPALPVNAGQDLCAECCQLPRNVPKVGDVSIGPFTAITSVLNTDKYDTQANFPQISHSHTNILGSAVQLMCAQTLQNTSATYTQAVDTARLTKAFTQCVTAGNVVKEFSELADLNFIPPDISEQDVQALLNTPSHDYTPPPLPLAQRDCSPMGFRRLPWRIAWRMQAHLVKLAAVLPSLPFLAQHARIVSEGPTPQTPLPATHFDFFPVYSVYLTEQLARKPFETNSIRRMVSDDLDVSAISDTAQSSTSAVAAAASTAADISISISIPHMPASPPPKIKGRRVVSILTSPPPNKVVESMEFTLDSKYNCKQVVSQYATVEYGDVATSLVPVIPTGRILDNLPSNSSHVISNSAILRPSTTSHQDTSFGSPKINQYDRVSDTPSVHSPATPRVNIPAAPASVTHKNSAYSVTYTFEEGSSVAAQLKKSNSYAISHSGGPPILDNPVSTDGITEPTLLPSVSLDTPLHQDTPDRVEYHMSAEGGHIVLEQNQRTSNLAKLPAPCINTYLSASPSTSCSDSSTSNETLGSKTSLPLSPSFHRTVSQATLRTASGVTTVTVTGHKMIHKNTPSAASVNVNIVRALPVSVSAQIPCTIDLITMANILPVYVTPVAFAHAIELSMNDSSIYAHLKQESSAIAAEPVYSISSDLNHSLDDTMTIENALNEQQDIVNLPSVLSTVNITGNTWTDITKQFDRSLGVSASMSHAESRKELFQTNQSLAKLIPNLNLSIPNSEGRNMNVQKDSLRTVMSKELVPSGCDMCVLTLDAVEALHSDGDVSDTFENETAMFYCAEELQNSIVERSVDDDLHSEMLLQDVHADINPFLQNAPLAFNFWSSTWRNSPHCVSLPVLLRLRQGVISGWTSLLDTVTCTNTLEHEPLSLHEYNMFESNLGNPDCALPEPVLKETNSPMPIIQCAQRKDVAFVPFISAFIDQNQMASVFQLTRMSPLQSSESVLQWVRLWADLGRVYKDHQRWRIMQQLSKQPGDNRNALGLHIPHPIFTAVPGASSCPTRSQAALWSMQCNSDGRPLKYFVADRQSSKCMPNIHTLLDLSYTNVHDVPRSLLPLQLAVRCTASTVPRIPDWYSLISLAQAHKLASSTALLEPVVGTLYLRKVGLFTSWEDYTFYLGDSTDPYALVYYKPTQQLHDAERLYTTALHRFQKATADAVAASQNSKGSSILSQCESARDSTKAAVLQAQMQRNQIRLQHKAGQITLTKRMWVGVPNPQGNLALPSPYLFELRIDPADAISVTALQMVAATANVSHTLKHALKWSTKEHILPELLKNPFPFGTNHVAASFIQNLPCPDEKTQPQIYQSVSSLFECLYPSLFPYLARGQLQAQGADAQIPMSLMAAMTPPILLEKHNFFSPSRVTLTTATQQRPKRTPTKCTDNYAISQVFFATLPSHASALHTVPFVQAYNEALHHLRYIDSSRGISDKELSRLEELQIQDGVGAPLQFTTAEAIHVLRVYLSPLTALPTMLARQSSGKAIVLKSALSILKGGDDDVSTTGHTSLSLSAAECSVSGSLSPTGAVLRAPSIPLTPSIHPEPTSSGGSSSCGLPKPVLASPSASSLSSSFKKKSLAVLTETDIELTKLIMAFAPLTGDTFTSIVKTVQTSVYSSACLQATNACEGETYLQVLLYSQSGAPELGVPKCSTVDEEDAPSVQSVDLVPSPGHNATVSISLCASDAATRAKWIRAIRARTTVLKPIRPEPPQAAKQEVLQSPELLTKITSLLVDTSVEDRKSSILSPALLMLLSFVALKSQATNAWLVLIINTLGRYVGATPQQLLHCAHKNALGGSPLSLVLYLLPQALRMAANPPLSLLSFSPCTPNISLQQLALLPQGLLPPLLNPCADMENATKDFQCNHKLLSSALLLDVRKCIKTVQSVTAVMRRQVGLCVLKTQYGLDPTATETVFFPNPHLGLMPRNAVNPCSTCGCCNTATHNDVLGCSKPLEISVNIEWLYARVCAAFFELINLFHHILLASIESLPVEMGTKSRATLYKAAMSHLVLTNAQNMSIVGPQSVLLQDSINVLALTMMYPRYCLHNGSISHSFAHYTAFLQLFLKTNVDDSIKLANIGLSMGCITPTTAVGSSNVDVVSALTCNNPEQVSALYKLLKDVRPTLSSVGKVVKMIHSQTTFHSSVDFIPYRLGYATLFTSAPYQCIDEPDMLCVDTNTHSYEELLSTTQVKTVCYSLSSACTFKAWYIQSPLFSHQYACNYSHSMYAGRSVTTLPILLPYHPMHLQSQSKGVFYDPSKYAYNTLVRPTSVLLNPHTLKKAATRLVLDHCLCASTYSLSYTDITLAYIQHQSWSTLPLVQARRVKSHEMVPNTQTVASASSIIAKIIQVKVCASEPEALLMLNRLCKVGILLHVKTNPYRLDESDEPTCYCKEEMEISNSLLDYYYLQAPRSYMG